MDSDDQLSEFREKWIEEIKTGSQEEKSLKSQNEKSLKSQEEKSKEAVEIYRYAVMLERNGKLNEGIDIEMGGMI